MAISLLWQLACYGNKSLRSAYYGISNTEVRMAQVRVEKVTIPTYETFEYDKNPMFLEKRVYQGSSGRVYPHPVCEGIRDEKTDREYTAVYMENDQILVMILPELGGRIQRLYDKTNGYDAVYYNEVIKPALVGLAGPWISGGIEFNWPQHHRPSTFDPVDYCVAKNDDGSVTVTVGETEKMFHTRSYAEFTVYDDRAYLEIKGNLYNPTDLDQTFLWWANPAVAVNDHTRSIFPPDVHAVFDHGKRDVSDFPIATGVYYKVDYAPGTDISRYKNIPVPTSYMAHHSDYDFIGNYDDSRNAGLLHIADHHISPGKKQWTWGNGDFGKAWDRNLTDANGPYIELMTGVFTDNQPDFTYLKPYEEKHFVQFFMPYRDCGAVKNADTDYCISYEYVDGNAGSEAVSGDSSLRISVYSFVKHDEPVTVSLKLGEKEIYRKEAVLAAAESLVDIIPAEVLNQSLSDTPGTLGTPGTSGTSGTDNDPGNSENKGERLRLSLFCGNEEILAYQETADESEMPSAKDPMPAPEAVESLEDLYLCGMHLEQYRHATYDPAAYYLEGLRRDRTDMRLNNAYGKLLCKKGRYTEAVPYFKESIKKAVTHNPNPYDCEAYYNLGMAYYMTGGLKKAYDAFYKATWDGSMQSRAFHMLAVIASCFGRYPEALEFAEASLDKNRWDMKARGLKTVLLRKIGKTRESEQFARETLAKDPLDLCARHELMPEAGSSFDEGLRLDNSDITELGMLYLKAGMPDEAMRAYARSKDRDEPMINFYSYFATGDKEYLEKAGNAPYAYCFPNRVEDIAVLEKAIEAGSCMAAYYLGCLMYDKGNHDRAIGLWESVTESVNKGALADFATVHRNLALAYYNKKKDADRALKEMETAFGLDRSDPRVFYELDQLYKELERPAAERLEKMEASRELVEKRDPLYTEYITLLNDNGRFGEAYECIMNHRFHPWEGGEGKITAQYKRCLIAMASDEADDKKAVAMLKNALSYPENLGEGKLIGQLDNDVYYYMAGRSTGEAVRTEYLKMAARGRADFSSAMYYNDQPPEMVYFMALAIAGLGRREEAEKILNDMKEYGHVHMNDHIRIEYFAVSLPDFLIFEADLDRKNRKHCENMIRLGSEGLKLIETGI